MKISISNQAIMLLDNAIKGNSTIIIIKTLSSIVIQSGEMSISLSHDSTKEKVEWEYAIEELYENNFIKDRGIKKEVFEITKQGFDFYDNLYKVQNDIKNYNNTVIDVGNKIIHENESYLVEKCIGNGGCGKVFQIKRISDGNKYALKTIISDDDINTINNEIKLAFKINSNNIVKYLYFHDGSDGTIPYIIMEYVEGMNLEEYIKKRKEIIKNDELLNIYNQIIDGMISINSELVHRDIKPSNILITNAGVIKITDFGISKPKDANTRSLTLKGYGTYAYIAPEGWKNEKNTIQMDIYSMGIVFYELATKQYPYALTNKLLEDYRNAHLTKVPENPNKFNGNLDSLLVGIIMKMLEKEPHKRFSDFKEIKEVFNNLINVKPNNYLTDIINKRVERDRQVEQKKLEVEKRKTDELETIDIVKFSFENNIINPIKNYISEFNKLYLNGMAKVLDKVEHSGSVSCTVISVDNEKTNIELEIIKTKRFVRKEKNLFYSSEYSDIEKEYYEKEYRPTIKNKNILAWGRIIKENGSGINIYLLEDEKNIYGEWFYSITTNSAFSSLRERIEPICFKFQELEREVDCFNAMHIYSTSINKINEITDIIPFIDICNV